MNAAAPVTEKELKVFVDAIGNFFSQLDPTPPEIRAAFLSNGSLPPPTHDFTGVIELSGAYRGSVAFSAPRVMLRRVMLCLKEPAQSDADFLDATGEIANIFAGNARRHFGENLEISVPRIHAGPTPQLLRQRGRAVVIVISWMGNKATVLVDVERVQ